MDSSWATSLRVWPQHEDGILYGFVDHKGKFVITEQFDYANPFSDGFASIEVDRQHGYINHAGQWLTTQRFAEATDFHDGVAWVIEKGDCAADGLCGVYTVGKPPIPPAVSRRCRYSLLNTKGEIVAAEAYLDVKPFSEGLAPVSDGKLWGYSDRSGKLVIPLQFDYAQPFSEGVAAACTSATSCGHIDNTGAMVIPATFRETRDFSEGLAAVQLESGWYSYIDRTGRIVIRGQFDAPSNFVKGLAHVAWRDEQDTTHWSYIDRTGKTVFTYTRRREERP